MCYLYNFRVITSFSVTIMTPHYTHVQLFLLQIRYLGRRGGSNLGTATRVIMSEFMDKELAVNFNWEGRRGPKIGFSKFKLSSCIMRELLVFV